MYFAPLPLIHHLLRSYGALMEQSHEMMFESNGAFLQTSIKSAQRLRTQKMECVRSFGVQVNSMYYPR